jgi:tRNA 2-selenouridine synthase
MQILTNKEFMSQRKLIPVVDVRSPGEFADGHIPGAINIPIFNNEERAIVGTIYKSKGRVPAIEKGLEIVGPKMAMFVRMVVKIATSGQLLIYCWRGGMRSESMAWLFERVGINCFILQGGYKSYRNYLLEITANIPYLIVIEGYTGSGKTEILHSLRLMGEQVIDLEGHANHKGSVFGGIGQQFQPTTQQFQNELLDVIIGFDISRRVWIEGESQTVGRVFLPEPLWHKMNQTQNIEIFIPREFRIARLVKEYGTLPEELMEIAIISIAKRLGDLRMREILDFYREKKFDSVADKLLEYYDQTYQYSRDKYKKKLTEVVLSKDDPDANAKLIMGKASQLF